MERKFSDDDEFIKLLEEQFEEEARMMEEALFSHEDFQDDVIEHEKTAASYEKLVERLKADGVYREDDEAVYPEPGNVLEAADRTAESDIAGKDAAGKNAAVENAPARRVFVARLRPVAKVAGFLLVCVIGVFAASMTSEGNRRYVVETFRYFVDGNARVIIGNDEKNEDVNEDEYYAISEIEKKIGVNVPEFYYRPNGFEYYAYNIDETVGVARLEYKYQENIIMIFMDKEDTKQASGVNGLHGQQVENVTTIIDKIHVIIKEISNDNGSNSYSAEWTCNDVVYIISGKMEKEEFVNLIRNIAY